MTKRQDLKQDKRRIKRTIQRAEDNICPRCLGSVPSEHNKGQYFGEESLVAYLEICALCGQDEAFTFIKNFGRLESLIPQSEWPISRNEVEERMFVGRKKKHGE